LGACSRRQYMATPETCSIQLEPALALVRGSNRWLLGFSTLCGPVAEGPSRAGEGVEVECTRPNKGQQVLVVLRTAHR
jgi:hypothetical protein